MDSTTLQDAVRKLDSLTIASEPEDPNFGDLMITQTSLYLKLNQLPAALKSWRLAKQVASASQDVALKALCLQIRTAWKDTSLSADCAKIPPLAKPVAASLSVTVARSSSSTLRPVNSAPAQASSSSAAAVATKSSAVVSDPSAQGQWVLQFGAFGNKDNADIQLQTLKSRKVSVRLVTKNGASRTLYLVQTEPFPSKDAAIEYGQKSLAPMGLDFQALPVQ